MEILMIKLGIVMGIGGFIAGLLIRNILREQGDLDLSRMWNERDIRRAHPEWFEDEA